MGHPRAQGSAAPRSSASGPPARHPLANNRPGHAARANPHIAAYPRQHRHKASIADSLGERADSLYLPRPSQPARARP